jgi:hypothetical protein
MTGFTVSCTGSNCGTPVVASAARKAGADSIVRLTISGIGGTGNCAVGQTWTWSYSPGNVTDSSSVAAGAGGIGSAPQPLLAASSQPVTSVCSGSGTTPPSTGLVAHYLFDEGSGTSLNDQTAGNHDGTITLPSWVSGGGLLFDNNVNNVDYAEVPDGATWGTGKDPSAQDASFCLDFEPTAGTESGTNVIAGTYSSTQRFYIGRDSGFWGIGIGTSSVTIHDTGFPVQAGRAFLCLVGNATSNLATLYVNGVAGTGNNVKSISSFTLPSPLRIGQLSSGTVDAAGTVRLYKFYDTALSAQDVLDLFNAWNQVSPDPSGTFSQVTHKWQYLRNQANGTAKDITINGTTNGLSAYVVSGGAIALITQIDCTVADCDPTGLHLFYNKNGGAFSQVSDTVGADASFYGTPDMDIVSGTVTCCLTGSLTANDGPTNTSSAAVPVIDLAQNASFVRRSILKFASTLVDGDVLCFKEYHQTDLALDSYAPSGGACVTIVAQNMGKGF